MSEPKKPTVSMVLKTSDAAQYLGTSAQMLRLSRHTGELYKGIPAPKFAKCGRIVLYKKTELDRWIDQQKEYENNAQVNFTLAFDARKSPS
jgi:hypothetical protein